MSSKKVLIGAAVLIVGVVGYVSVFMGHSAASLTPVEAGSTAKAGLISSGEAVDLAAHARAQGLTVFEFMSPM